MLYIIWIPYVPYRTHTPLIFLFLFFFSQAYIIQLATSETNGL